VRQGVALLPESRKDQGLVLMRSVRDNVSLARLDRVTRAGVLRVAEERRAVDAALAKVDTRAASVSLPVSALSGGNQQKVALAKWLVLQEPRLLIADEPTRGVDVGARRSIYEVLQQLAASGVAILMISSELEEVLGFAHRVLVIRRGRLVAGFDAASCTDEQVMSAAFGDTRDAADRGSADRSPATRGPS
jgi:ABC-type sugar transport system ATPase subunit